jgi:hypothetical protein
VTALARFGFFAFGWLCLGAAIYLAWFGANLLITFWKNGK